jgi:iron(III) transport system ATP-binding protein
MRAEIRRLCKEFGLTAIYVSHDQKEALAIGDRIVVMDAGSIRQVGSPLDVYRHPRSRFVAEFLGETNLLDGLHDGSAIVTSAGPFHVAGFDASAPAQLLLISIRPEAWRLTLRPEPVNSFPGKIIETVYLGEIARHRFLLDAGQELIIYELNPRLSSTATHLSPASPISLYASVSPEDVTPILEP